jgi:hypothetical protein
MGRIALTRGPLLYCIERADNADINLSNVELPDASVITSTFEPNLLNGVVTLSTDALVTAPGDAWTDRLYRTAADLPATTKPARITAIPYFAWSNRTPGPMRVWFKRSR